jgi:hypothetical protein
VSPTPSPEDETDPVSEMLCSLQYWTMVKVQKPSNHDKRGLFISAKFNLKEFYEETLARF